MDRSTMVAAALVLALAHWAHAGPADEARALGEKFKAAVVTGEVDAVLALYADDPRVIYPGQGAEARGKTALRALLEKELPGMRSQPMTQKSGDAIPIDGSHILNVGVWDATVPGPGGRPTTVVVRTTELLMKEGGTWRYLVDHASIGVSPAPRARDRGRRRR
jgi:ketosteroid isomerase-like protein